MMTFADLITEGGYRCGEVTSAMQKCIRRGLEDDALFWATELDRSNYGEYVWKRLKIIASEDIGLADPKAAILIGALYTSWREQKKKDDNRHAPERLFLVHAVIALSRCKKSRMVDHALIAMYEARREHREIPDFALDKHTARGKQKKRAWAHFWEEGAKLENQAPLNDPYEATARQTRRDLQQELEL
jgi:replication-associated recombination protein RarA